jgi:hypothetical protein
MSSAPAATGAPATSGSHIPWGQIAGAGAGILGDIIGHSQYQDPYAQAEQTIGQIPGEMGQYMNPYIEAGRQAIPTLESQYSALLKDPTALMSRIGSQYKASPGYQYNVDQATQAANRAAAAGGMAGSPAEQAELAKTITGLSSQDYNEFMNRALGLYGTGLSGYGGLERGGQQASQQMAENMARIKEMQASAQEASAQSQNQQKGGFWGTVAGIAADALPMLF